MCLTTENCGLDCGDLGVTSVPVFGKRAHPVRGSRLWERRLDRGPSAPSDAGVPQSRGTIELCPHQGCAFQCCDFKQMVHILLYPGEVEEALARGHSMAHLELIDSNHHGGARARCRATDTATCDHGYKPLDCASYPFFPELSEPADGRDSQVTVAKGSGCPIQGREIPHHARHVREVWRRLAQGKPAVAAWLRSLSRSNTDAFDPEPYDPF